MVIVTVTAWLTSCDEGVALPCGPAMAVTVYWVCADTQTGNKQIAENSSTIVADQSHGADLSEISWTGRQQADVLFPPDHLMAK
jgi:hypothetical protein